MDKVKEQLAVVAKYSFWIMCGAILAVCLGSWWVSTASLATQQKKQYDDIVGNFKAMETLQVSNPKHPNQSTAEGMEQLIRNYSHEVGRGWQLQYDQQATVLVWPESFDEEFRNLVNKLRPIEIVPPPPTPIDKDLPIRERQLYRDFISDELPTLAKTIGTEWRASAASVSSGDGFGTSGGTESYGGVPGAGATSGFGPSSFGPGGSGPGAAGPGAGYPGDSSTPYGTVVEDKSIVLWSPTNQQELLTTHFGFIAREDLPSTLDVLYAQEDLWVLQNIMDIIKAANRVDDRDAVARHEATVKMIDFVRIGRSAMGLAGQITPVGAAVASAGGGYGPGGMSGGMGSAGMGPGGMMSGPMSGPGGSAAPGGAATSPDSSAGAAAGVATGTPDGYGGMGATAVSTDPAFGRYVDEKYQPLDPKRLRDALTSKSPADALLAVAKRMPVRLRFNIDQRRLNKLLAECGNSRLPVEVRQVRINREPAPAGGMGGYGSGPGSSDGGYGSGGMTGIGGADGGLGGLAGLGGMASGPGGMTMSGGYRGGGSAEGGYGPSGGFGPSGGVPGMAAGPRRVGGADSTATIDLNMIFVELYGIVYIYNPVNKSQLGQAEAATTVSTPPAVTPTTPVSTPTPDATSPTSTTVPPAAIVPTSSGG